MFHVKHHAPPLVRLRAFCHARLVFVPRSLAYPETNVSRETPHVRRLPQAFSRPTEAPRPRPLRLPPGPARLTHPRVRLPGPRASRSCASLASRPGLRILAPRPHPRLSLAPPGPARLARVPACACAPRRPRPPRSGLLHPSCSPVAPPFPFVALPMPGLSKSKRYQLRFYQHLHSTSTFATQQLSGRLNDRLSAFTQVTGGFSPRNNREGALTRPREASMVILGELNSLTGINET